MKYAREHVRKFWMVQNMRTLGMLMVMFSVLYSIGFIFTTLLDRGFVGALDNVLIMWGIIFALLAAMIIGSIVIKHRQTTLLMNKLEHSRHSKNIGIFLIAIVAGAVLFSLPATLFPQQATLIILFSLGGIMLLVYLALALVFGHGYVEVGAAAFFLWAVFIIGVFTIGQMSYSNPPLFNALSLIVSTTAIVIVFAMTGVLILYRASGEFLPEFRKAYRIK
ncbi:MAG: hypothetical protein KGH61_01730 [Candidatus Micrarchaeota archaeon]|nr:hypothetical protein [Candidatus Micrarchaeota archaeon]MDE1847650.1 hypothetical protein [Candidatus Micrarchaeota archaeon]MDE1864471.1 hypothetical protein [Candidatus Micrarchaeota archaeon]